AIRKQGHRPKLVEELGVLYRLVNALTFPHYRDVHHPALARARVRHRPRETFERVDDVIGFLAELLSDYVYPQLNPDQLASIRIYFAYYLGDGVATIEGVDSRACWDLDDSDNRFAGEFIIGLANPIALGPDRDWRVGRAIKGYSGAFPESMCAKVFDAGQL